MEVLADIPFELDSDDLAGNLRIKPRTDAAHEFSDFLEEVRALAVPKALFKECYVEARGEDTVTIDGVTFTSRTLRMNLDAVGRVFPYVATCGDELDSLDIPRADIIKRFWLDTVQETLLSFSISHLNAYLVKKYRLGKTASMSPGSGDVMVWPIEQQRELFALLGDVKGMIGVELTGSCLMVPIKSVSGIRFPTEIDFETCQLCRRKDCRLRAAPFSRDLWDSIHGGLGPEA